MDGQVFFSGLTADPSQRTTTSNVPQNMNENDVRSLIFDEETIDVVAQL